MGLQGFKDEVSNPPTVNSMMDVDSDAEAETSMLASGDKIKLPGTAPSVASYASSSASVS